MPRPLGDATDDARLISAAPDLIDALQESYAVICQYQGYAKSMRDIGRGFEPTGNVGQSLESVIALITQAIAKAEGKL
jgi:hypothetical protein